MVQKLLNKAQRNSSAVSSLTAYLAFCRIRVTRVSAVFQCVAFMHCAFAGFIALDFVVRFVFARAHRVTIDFRVFRDDFDDPAARLALRRIPTDVIVQFEMLAHGCLLRG
jgi:hypothetical protein